MKTLFTALMEKALRKYLQLDPDTLAHMAELTGKVIKVEITEPNICVYLFPDATGIRIRGVYDGEADASIKGSLFVLVYASVSSEETIKLRNEIELGGDVELAHKFSQILQQRHVDWEEPLSRWVGDFAAHKIGNAVRGANKWRKQVSGSLRENLTEYLQEALAVVPPREEVEDFFADIYRLRNDIERLAANIQLQQEEAVKE